MLDRSLLITIRWPLLKSFFCSGGNPLSVYLHFCYSHSTYDDNQRKCWWDGIEVDLAQNGEAPKVVKLWARRVWTLELSLVSTHSRSFTASVLKYMWLGLSVPPDLALDNRNP